MLYSNFTAGVLSVAVLICSLSSTRCFAQNAVPTGGAVPTTEPSSSYTQTTVVHQETVKPHHHHGLIPEALGVTGKAVKVTIGLPGKAVKETFKALF